MSVPTEPLRIGIAGLGTVGAGVLQNLRLHGDRLAMAMGRRIEVVGVSARSRDKDRGVPLDGIPWYDNPVELAAAPGVSAFVELIGGEEQRRLDPARRSRRRCQWRRYSPHH